MSNNSVEIISFTKKYASKTACDEIDFIAKENSITGLLGPNGAGKSTLLKTICGEIYPTSGSVSVCGLELPQDIKKIIGFVPETPELESNLTVKETLLLEADLFSVKDAVSSIEKAVKLCDLEDVLSCKIRTLSKGYRQRVNLAKAICIEPKVLVLDEFSAGLDPKQTVHLRKGIKELSKSTTVIFSTHHIEEAISLCDVIYIMNHGKIVAEGTAESISTKQGCRNLEDAYLRLIEGGV